MGIDKPLYLQDGFEERIKELGFIEIYVKEYGDHGENECFFDCWSLDCGSFKISIEVHDVVYFSSKDSDQITVEINNLYELDDLVLALKQISIPDYDYTKDPAFKDK